MSHRISFLIDGFNVYHSIKQAISDKIIKCGKWLDYRALCTSYLGLIDSDPVLASVYYFSAVTLHFPEAAKKHHLLLDVLW